MKRIGQVAREKIIEEIRTDYQKSEGCFFVNFNKVKASSISQLRNNLRVGAAHIYVAKNALLQKAFDEVDKQGLAGFLNGETGVVFVYDKDIVKTCKALVDFAKENEILQLKGGFLKNRKITTEDVAALAKLPPKEVLLSMAVSALASPVTGFLSTLNQIVLKFVWVLEEVKKTKEKK
ncbi:MAG: 50S ribosomal protein L10 [Candidatus Omnitrophota bacterium]